MQLFIKNMVCNRCIMTVEDILEEEGLAAHKIVLGEVQLHEEALNTEQKTQLRQKLENKGFELLGDYKTKLVEKVKNLVVNYIHHLNVNEQKSNWSVLIKDELGYDYNYLGRVFNEVEGQSIGQYIIAQKIEKAKELVLYKELTLSQIAWDLGYSSVSHLSKQFKQVVGMTPGEFKQNGQRMRNAIDQL